MKVIGISASPRSDKATEYAVKKALDAVREENSDLETGFISLAKLKVSPCTACGYCNDHFECANQSDDYNEIAEIFKDDDVKGIILGSPVYMGGMTAQAKAFLDRTVMFRRNGFSFKDIVGAAVTVGGSRNGGQELVLQSIHAAFLIHGMIVVGDTNPTAHFGGAGWERFEGGIENDLHANSSFINTGKRVGELINLLNKK